MAQIQYSVAEIAEVAGAKARSVQLWTEAGALEPIGGEARTGRGQPRVFSADAAAIACVLQAFAARGLPIKELAHIGRRLRQQGVLKDITRHIEHEAKAYMVVSWFTERGKARMTVDIHFTRKPFAAVTYDPFPALSQPDGMVAVLLLNNALARLA